MSDFTIVYTDAGRTSPIWIERISGDTFHDALLAMIRDTDATGSQETDEAAAKESFLASCHSVEVFDGHLPEARTAAEVLSGEQP
jgi:hypothetical protein